LQHIGAGEKHTTEVFQEKKKTYGGFTEMEHSWRATSLI
jgi:hypothetical protein